MKRTDEYAIIDNSGRCKRIAYVLRDELRDFAVDSGDDAASFGDIFIGKVTRNMPSLQGAFVDIGEQTDAFLSYSSPNKTLQEGEIRLFQIVLESFDNKPVRVCEKPTLEGFFVKFSASDQGSSYKSEADDVSAYRQKIQSLGFSGEWMVKRSANKANPDLFISEIKDVYGVWQDVRSQLLSDETPRKVYSTGGKFGFIIHKLVGIDKIYLIGALIDDEYAALEPSIEYMTIDQAILKFGRLDEYVINTFTPQVVFSDGNVVIEKTAACTVVDVNSASASTGSKQLNVMKTNIGAAECIGRELSLRDIGGSILIDFITPKKAEDKKRIVDKLKETCKNDLVPITVYDSFTRLNLVEVTRKRSFSRRLTIDEIDVMRLKGQLRRLALVGVKKVVVYCSTVFYDKLVSREPDLEVGLSFSLEEDLGLPLKFRIQAL